jgi:CRISP-associated protein Cas1
MPVTEMPELVPARMINEFAYCPRLFFLEWVDQLWASSSDTAEGDRLHGRVDAGGGAVPLPSEGEVKAARSVELSSERLGITAKLDLLEGADGGVVPVDTKKGRPARDGGPWEADAVQVCAQVLLLREHGYTVERGEIFYAEPGSVVGIDGGRLTVSKYREVLATVRLIDVLHVCAYGNVQVTAQAMRALFEREVDIFHFSYGGWLLGLSAGLPSKNVMLRIRQTTAAARGQLDAPRRMIAGKIRNCRVLLRRNGDDAVARRVAQLAALADQAEQVEDAASLLGIEGTAARLYFEAFPSLLTGAARLPGPGFTGLRNRRPPTDAVNCLLSFCYGLLTKEMLAACLAVGFDPYIGLYHRPRFGRPALALDLAEEFRPLLADSTVLTCVNNREIGPSDFLVRAGAVTLTAEGRKTVIRSWERRMTTEVRHPLFGYKVTYRRAVELQARILAAWLTGELAAYTPLVTR